MAIVDMQPRVFDEVLRSARWRPPYETTTATVDGGFRQDIEFRTNIPMHVELEVGNGVGLRERIQFGDRTAEVRYLPTNDSLQASQLVIFNKEGKPSQPIDLNRLSPVEKTTFTTGETTVSIFGVHPDMNPHNMFGGGANYDGRYELGNDHTLSVHFDGEQLGFTIPKNLNTQTLIERAQRGMTIFDQQVFVLPNTDGSLISDEEIGFQPAAMPVVIGASVEDQQSNINGPKLILVSQRFGHATLLTDMSALGRQADEDITTFVIPTDDVTTRIARHEADGIDLTETIKPWCYTPEEGYGGGDLPLNPTNPNSSLTMLNFLATNPQLVEEVAKNATRGIVMYTDTKQDVVFLNLLAKAMNINILPVSKTYSVFQNGDFFGPHNGGAAIYRMMQRVREATQEAPDILRTLGQTEAGTPNFITFMADKMRAVSGGISLYSTPDMQITLPTALDATEMVAIPLAFSGIENETLISREEARRRLSERIYAAHPANIDTNLTMRLADPSDKTPLVSIQFGTSRNLYTEEALRLMTQVAKAMPDTIFTLTGFADRESYVKTLLEVTGLRHESDLPKNLIVLGMVSGIRDVVRAHNVVISPGGLGNITDALRTKTPLILFTPDTISKGDLQSTNARPSADAYAVAIETAPERAANIAAVAMAYYRRGITPNNTVIDLPTSPSTEDVVSKITYALNNDDAMSHALGDIPTVPVEFLLQALFLLKQGGRREEIAQLVHQYEPRFSPTYTSPISYDTLAL